MFRQHFQARSTVSIHSSFAWELYILHMENYSLIFCLFFNPLNFPIKGKFSHKECLLCAGPGKRQAYHRIIGTRTSFSNILIQR
jgi:hypothetical protein